MVASGAVRVLVTRPEPGAGRTAALLRDRGFQPILLPLTVIQPVPAPDLRILADAVAVTSANAVRSPAPTFVARFREMPCFAVGHRTAEACREAGFQTVHEGGGTADALVDRLIAETRPGAQVVYLCGSPRKPVLEARLAQAGRLVHAVETYRAERLVPSRAQCRSLEEEGFHAALLYSAEGATALADVLRGCLPTIPQTARFLCLSADVAKPLSPPAQTIVAPEPTEAALLQTLFNTFGAARG